MRENNFRMTSACKRKKHTEFIVYIFDMYFYGLNVSGIASV